MKGLLWGLSVGIVLAVCSGNPVAAQACGSNPYFGFISPNATSKFPPGGNLDILWWSSVDVGVVTFSIHKVNCWSDCDVGISNVTSAGNTSVYIPWSNLYTRELEILASTSAHGDVESCAFNITAPTILNVWSTEVAVYGIPWQIQWDTLWADGYNLRIGLTSVSGDQNFTIVASVPAAAGSSNWTAPSSGLSTEWGHYKLTASVVGHPEVYYVRPYSTVTVWPADLHLIPFLDFPGNYRTEAAPYAVLLRGSTYNITWTTNGTLDAVSPSIVDNSGSTVETFPNQTNSGYLIWSIPANSPLTSYSTLNFRLVDVADPNVVFFFRDYARDNNGQFVVRDYNVGNVLWVPATGGNGTPAFMGKVYANETYTLTWQQVGNPPPMATFEALYLPGSVYGVYNGRQTVNVSNNGSWTFTIPYDSRYPPETAWGDYCYFPYCEKDSHMELQNFFGISIRTSVATSRVTLSAPETVVRGTPFFVAWSVTSKVLQVPPVNFTIMPGLSSIVFSTTVNNTGSMWFTIPTNDPAYSADDLALLLTAMSDTIFAHTRLEVVNQSATTAAPSMTTSSPNFVGTTSRSITTAASSAGTTSSPSVVSTTARVVTTARNVAPTTAVLATTGPPTTRVQVVIVLNANYTKFVRDPISNATFAAAIAGVLGIHSSRILVVNVWQGSLGIEFAIMPDQTNSTAPAPATLAGTLIAEFQTHNAALSTALSYLGNITSMTSPDVGTTSTTGSHVPNSAASVTHVWMFMVCMALFVVVYG